jgi:hypothetical protein
MEAMILKDCNLFKQEDKVKLQQRKTTSDKQLHESSMAEMLTAQALRLYK